MDNVNEIRDEIQLIRDGKTANEAELIMQHKHDLQRVIDSRPNYQLYIAFIIVIILIVVVMFITAPEQPPKYRHDICDAWVNRTGHQYYIYKQDPVSGLFIGSGPHGRFTMQIEDDYIVSSLPFGIGKVTKDRLMWDNEVWSREKVIY